MRDEPQQISTVDRRVEEALALPVPVRILPAAADVHDRAGLALPGQGGCAYLPGDRRRVRQSLIEAVRHNVEASVGGARISGAQRVELLNRTVGVDHDQRARP
jgi:hypothetical protein